MIGHGVNYFQLLESIENILEEKNELNKNNKYYVEKRCFILLNNNCVLV